MRAGGRFAAGLAVLALCAAPVSARADTVLGFIPVPAPDELRSQVITPQPGENWPFTERRLTLYCAKIWGQAQSAILSLDGVGDDENPRVLPLMVHPMMAFYAEPREQALIRTYPSLEARLDALRPFLALGERLCDQPEGTALGPGEL